MDRMMLVAFMDELLKIAEGNYASPQSTGKGSNIVTQPASSAPGTGRSSMSPAVKSTNYSIVNSEAPMAAETVAPAATKAVPPPPVRT